MDPASRSGYEISSGGMSWNTEIQRNELQKEAYAQIEDRIDYQFAWPSYKTTLMSPSQTFVPHLGPPHGSVPS